MKKITPSKKDIEEYMKEDMGLARAILEAFSKLYIYDKHLIIVPPNKPCQKSRSIFSVVRIEKGTDLVRI